MILVEWHPKDPEVTSIRHVPWRWLMRVEWLLQVLLCVTRVLQIEIFKLESQWQTICFGNPNYFQITCWKLPIRWPCKKEHSIYLFEIISDASGEKKCLYTYKNGLDTSFFLQLLNSFNDPLQICVTALVIVNAVKSKPLLLEGTVVRSYCKALVLHWIWCQLIESCTSLDSDLEHELHWLSEFWWCKTPKKNEEFSMAGGVNLKNITIILLGHFHVHVSKPLCFCSGMCANIKKMSEHVKNV